MKAVLLVGGKGTRLRPLTYRVPKPLVPVMGKPLMMHVIDSLPEEVDETIVPVGYMREAMEEYLRKNPPRRKITIVEEREPMGTGGAVKNVEEYIDGPFLVINGDSISSVDMESFVRYHRSKGAFATISLWEVEDPTPFGVVDMDDNGRIRRFQEKPTKEEAFSLLINAGAYALEYEALDYIADGFVSMEREVFPRILDRGMYGLRFEGFWVDCGTRENLLKAFWTLMRGGVMDDTIQSPPVVEERAEVSKAVIGANTYVSSGVSVGEHTRIANSVIYNGATIGRRCSITNSIVDVDVDVPDDTTIVDTIVSDADAPDE
ncbi:TPA: NDP-sugar synthase [Thermoplasmata archaeon]|nr:NDP-sugar synthase [Thermoplasmata archaeon]